MKRKRLKQITARHLRHVGCEEWKGVPNYGPNVSCSRTWPCGPDSRHSRLPSLGMLSMGAALPGQHDIVQDIYRLEFRHPAGNSTCGAQTPNEQLQRTDAVCLDWKVGRKHCLAVCSGFTVVNYPKPPRETTFYCGGAYSYTGHSKQTGRVGEEPS